MPGLLAEFDVLILASEYAEPLARAAQEAMAMGLLVVGTITGGSGELLVHEETGLAFEAGDPASLARQIERAARDPDQTRRLALAGRDAVRERFGILHTVLETEQYLQRLMDDSLSAGAADTHADVLDGAL
jgi:glycosyltransferase involved in cell wall biosynthesis